MAGLVTQRVLVESTGTIFTSTTFKRGRSWQHEHRAKFLGPNNLIKAKTSPLLATAVMLMATAVVSQQPANSTSPKPATSSKQPYQYFRVGNSEDIKTETRPGAALMGGGTDLDPAFKWLCDRANGGDFLILRATGDDDYNPYVQGLCKANSVATLILPDQAAAKDPFVATTINRAEAIFIAGGDQSNYIKYWKNTPVQTAINNRIRAGVPIGGTSAGLAVLGEYVFSAMHDTAYSKETLADPYNEGVTLTADFLHLPYMEKTITDQHFVKRDRLGRFVGFMARILQDGMSDTIRGIAVDEGNAVLVDEKGEGTLVGDGNAYFFRPKHKPEVCQPGKPLTFTDLQVYKIDHKGSFTLKDWSGSGGTWFVLSALEGKLQSSNGSVY